MRLLSAITGIPQKVALGAAAAIAIGSGIALTVQHFELNSAHHQVAALSDRIDDPKTGYVVLLAQARTNTATCTAALGRQSAAIHEQSTRDAATIAAVQAQYTAEHAKRVKAENAAAAFLAHKPVGATTAERVNDVDAQILGDLK